MILYLVDKSRNKSRTSNNEAQSYILGCLQALSSILITTTDISGILSPSAVVVEDNITANYYTHLAQKAGC